MFWFGGIRRLICWLWFDVGGSVLMGAVVCVAGSGLALGGMVLVVAVVDVTRNGEVVVWLAVLCSA